VENFMNRSWRIAILLPWLAVAAMLADIWMAYDRLPPVIASHFDINGMPNGWAPKAQFFTIIVPVALGLVLLFTLLLGRFTKLGGLGWLLLVAEYWATGLLFGLTHATLRVGLGETGRLEFPAGGWSLLMGAVLVIGEVSSVFTMRKRANVEHGTLVGEYVHNSAGMALFFACLAVGALAAAAMMPLPTVGKTTFGIVGCVIAGCAVWAWTGFTYRVTTAGLEIRTLGVPLRFVPANEMEAVRAEDCNPLTDFGGWGIRGIGHMRAYIWGGKRCVHVQTVTGDDIYLGIADPEALAHALLSLVPVEHRKLSMS
jgi:hypothetical protein